MCVKSRDVCINCLRPIKSLRAVVTIPILARLYVLTSVQALPLTVSSSLYPPGVSSEGGAHVGLFPCRGERWETHDRAECSFSTSGSWVGWLLEWRNQLSAVLCFSPLFSPSKRGAPMQIKF